MPAEIAAREFYRQAGVLDPAWVAQTRMLRSQPALLAQQLNTFAAVERELATAVTARTGEPHPSGYARASPPRRS